VQNPNPDRIDQLAESLRDKVPPAPQGGSSSSGVAKQGGDSSSGPSSSHGGNGVHGPTPQQQPPKQQQPQEQREQQQQQHSRQQERQQSSGGGSGPSLPARGAMPSLPARPGTKPAAMPGGGGPSLPSRPSGAPLLDTTSAVHHQTLDHCCDSGGENPSFLHTAFWNLFLNCQWFHQHQADRQHHQHHALGRQPLMHACRQTICRPRPAAAAAAGSRGQWRRRNVRSRRRGPYQQPSTPRKWWRPQPAQPPAFRWVAHCILMPALQCHYSHSDSKQHCSTACDLA
jgi:hypothetical protein